MGYQDRPLPLYEEIRGLGVLVLKYDREREERTIT